MEFKFYEKNKSSFANYYENMLKGPYQNISKPSTL